MNWDGTYWVNLTPHVARSNFTQGGQWTLYDDGVRIVNATAASPTQINLSWSDNSSHTL